MADKYTHEDLVKRLPSEGWKLVTGNDAMPVEGTLKKMIEATHDRRKAGQATGYIQELETAIEVDMLQIQELWRQLGLPT
jgi:hypothetical protein